MRSGQSAPGVGLVLVALAALCWGVSGGIAGILIEQGWDASVVSFYRAAVGLLLVGVYLVIRPGGNGMRRPRLWLWAVLAGLGVAGNFTFYFLSIAEGGVAVAATLMYSAPVFVYLVAFGLKLERATPVKWLAIALVMLGIVLLTRLYNVDAGKVTAAGIGFGLLAGLSYSAFIYGFKYAAGHGSPQAVLSIALFCAVVILFGVSDTAQAVAVLNAPQWWLFTLLGVLGAGLSFAFYVVGLKRTAPTLAAIVAMVEPVTASLFGVLVLAETLALTQILGLVLILATVTGLSLYSNFRR
jgi:drug/metabolite transporter (DMT)-like permease